MDRRKYPKFLKDLGLNLLLAQIEMLHKEKVVIPTPDKQTETALEDTISEDDEDTQETTVRSKLKVVD